MQKFKKFMSLKCIKALLVMVIMFIVSSFGYELVFGYGGGIVFNAYQSPKITAINVPLAVSHSQEGVFTKTLKDNLEVKVEVPKGAVEGGTTFRIKRESGNVSNLPSGDVAKLVGDIVKIEAKDIEDENVSNFLNDLKITLTIPGITKFSKVYYLQDDSYEWRSINNPIIDGDQVTFSINHLTRFAVFEVVGVGELNSMQIVNQASIIDNGSEIVKEVKGEFIEVTNMLADVPSSIVETVTKNEAMVVVANKSFVGMDKNSAKLFDKVISNYSLSNDQRYSLAYFIQNGTPTTKRLGAGENVGVVNSYISVFGKIPTTETEWQDVVKIANGRWPTARNIEAEEVAKNEKFYDVYKRFADMDNPNDNAAVTIMTYGLRPANRNLGSEKTAIGTFKSVYEYNPVSAQDWDIVRSIAYSGAIR